MTEQESTHPQGSIFKTDGSSKPCRACTDFKTWMKLGGPNSSKTNNSKQSQEEKPKETNNTKDNIVNIDSTADTSSKEKTSETKRENLESPVLDLAVRDQKAGICPPDSLELGSATWTFLHSVAAYYPDNPTDQHKKDALNLLNSLPRLYPCAPCAEDLAVDLPNHPPQVENSKQFSEWMCRLHNRNKLISFTRFSYY